MFRERVRPAQRHQDTDGAPENRTFAAQLALSSCRHFCRTLEEHITFEEQTWHDPSGTERSLSAC